jgi:hypothetical protein
MNIRQFDWNLVSGEKKAHPVAISGIAVLEKEVSSICLWMNYIKTELICQAEFLKNLKISQNRA